MYVATSFSPAPWALETCGLEESILVRIWVGLLELLGRSPLHL